MSHGDIIFAGAKTGLLHTEDGTGQMFFRPGDVETVDENHAGITGRVTTSRRLAGTRIVEVNVGTDGEPILIEVEIPLHASAERGAEVRFRPTRWKIFADG
jgi:sulfate transport system ATP-binding protein